MDRANAILQLALEKLVATAKRDGLTPPFQVTIADGAGVALLTEGDTVEHSFPFVFKLTDATGRTAELVVDESEPMEPAFVN